MYSKEADFPNPSCAWSALSNIWHPSHPRSALLRMAPAVNLPKKCTPAFFEGLCRPLQILQVIIQKNISEHMTGKGSWNGTRTQQLEIIPPFSICISYPLSLKRIKADGCAQGCIFAYARGCSDMVSNRGARLNALESGPVAVLTTSVLDACGDTSNTQIITKCIRPDFIVLAVLLKCACYAVHLRRL